ncbi:molybdopterin molybdotransferase MoeA [Salinarimonas ramus]|uniref:Molybdopterin molybdenumtransferase n=1 Tax=Salinarimonas ramus TaxID=690164 RepID=A0A917Q8X2_9HYPH|nr:gephyrin-like molybdotransferase Glp [Salinarimonas ramus]GGK35526.1 molybdopterin molybdenumtransferase MoeA [Salinarimonas ramus]
MISVAEARTRIVAAAGAPLATETVPLAECAGRTLARDLVAMRTQPPFAASAMDGWAVRAADVASAPVELRVVGTSAAGRRFAGTLGAGEAVRIFTGAPVPEGADTIVVQENAEALDEGHVRIREGAAAGRFVRPRGLDFEEGDVLVPAGRSLDARSLALAAAMNHPALPVRRRPIVAVIATGDELVMPGETPGPDQIVASNLFAIEALVAAAGGEPVSLGIARDTKDAIREKLAAARAAQADVIVTLGGASVGAHDLVQETLREAGMRLGFWKIAMRPGKPLMHGTLDGTLFLGLPGNPVSSLVCALLFLRPAIRALVGDPHADGLATEWAVLGAPLPENDGREDYVRATLAPRPGALPEVTPAPIQDSSMLGILARADALIVRPVKAPALERGEVVEIVRLDGVM